MRKLIPVVLLTLAVLALTTPSPQIATAQSMTREQASKQCNETARHWYISCIIIEAEGDVNSCYPRSRELYNGCMTASGY